MNIESFFKEKLSKVLFLEIKPEGINKIFSIKVSNSIPIPVISKDIISEIKSEDNFESIKATYMVEAMYYLLGCDKNFKYAKEYKKLLNAKDDLKNYIKGIIAKNVKNHEFMEAYIYLKGLHEVDPCEEYYNKLIVLGNQINESMDFNDELFYMVEVGKSIGYIDAFLYEARLKMQQGLFIEAKLSFEDYFRNLGINVDSLKCINNCDHKIDDTSLNKIIKEISIKNNVTPIETKGDYLEEILEEYLNVKNLGNYEVGKSKIYDAPKEALGVLIPLLNILKEDAELRYYIALCYRIMDNPYKAIYYLNEAYEIDSDLVNVFNELGINYSLLGEYDTAVSYFRKAFEATKSLEICTNLVLCYINMGNKKEAMLHYEIAKKISPKDKIVLDLEKLLREENHGIN